MSDVRQLCQAWLDEQDAKKYRRELLVALPAAIEHFEQKVARARKNYSYRQYECTEIRYQIFFALSNEEIDLVSRGLPLPTDSELTGKDRLESDKAFYNYCLKHQNAAFAYMVECEEQLIDLQEQLEILKSEK